MTTIEAPADADESAFAPGLRPRMDSSDPLDRLKFCGETILRRKIEEIEKDRAELAEYEASLPTTDAGAIKAALALLGHKTDEGPSGFLRACNAVALMDAATHRADLFEQDITFEALVDTIRETHDNLCDARRVIETVTYLLSRPARRRAEEKYGK